MKHLNFGRHNDLMLKLNWMNMCSDSQKIDTYFNFMSFINKDKKPPIFIQLGEACGYGLMITCIDKERMCKIYN